VSDLVYLGAGLLRLSAHRGIQLRPPRRRTPILAACWLAIIATAAWLGHSRDADGAVG
jgi:hypothetical protein